MGLRGDTDEVEWVCVGTLMKSNGLALVGNRDNRSSCTPLTPIATITMVAEHSNPIRLLHRSCSSVDGFDLGVIGKREWWWLVLAVIGRCFVVSTSPSQKLHFLQNYSLSSSSSTLKSTSTTSNQHSFTVDYLVKSCGLPPEKALSASNYITIKTPDKPDSVLAFFSNHGFTEIQITLLIRRLPQVLMSNPENTFLPKIEFFQSKGVSTQDTAKILSTTPAVLRRSLENQIIPSYNFFKEFLKSEEKTNATIKRCAVLLLLDLHTSVAPNIEALREIGMPESIIVNFLTNQPHAFTPNADRFKEILEEVKKMGFNPTKVMFGLAIHALRAMTKSTWEKKVEVYKKWGLSEDQILVAFGKQPWFMIVSVEKIMGIMDFFVNKMGWESSIVVRYPGLILLSLERRIIPRCLVYQILLSKGLLQNKFSLYGMLSSSESQFLNKFVEKYEEEAPELLKLYQEKLNLSK
ncbi:transcription termination factor MTERF2, chloroplastic-like [Cornus florida]|uniref:transcription termination factor MTERF2, chloroplastic-like n=1 Tax=Cornus florida TaxID=4283 RepID=UPI0028A29D2F|nr:transcription termination factor MTERF2, chloroplastic-like [Cornus florida]